MNDFRTDHLTTDEQRLIARVILSALPENPSGGGCRAFYTPEEWAARGEKYGTDAKLILCHDGGDLANLCSYDRCDYKAIDRLAALLEDIGFYTEQCTSWYSAVYPAPDSVVSPPTHNSKSK